MENKKHSKIKQKLTCEGCGLLKRERWVIRFRGKFLCTTCRTNFQFFREKRINGLSGKFLARDNILWKKWIENKKTHHLTPKILIKRN